MKRNLFFRLLAFCLDTLSAYLMGLAYLIPFWNVRMLRNAMKHDKRYSVKYKKYRGV